MKPCIKCGELKEITEFYRHSRMGDGHLNKCKDCCRKESIENRNSKREYYLAYDKQRSSLPHRKKAREGYRKTEAFKQVRSKANRKWSKNNKFKRNAHIKVKRALEYKYIIKKPCEVCGNKNVQAHHEDYSKPLEVIWLCPSCHAKLHKEKRRLAS